MSVRQSNVFSLTINLRNGVNLKFLEILKNYIKKGEKQKDLPEQGYIVREKAGTVKEHLHGTLVYRKPRDLESVQKRFRKWMADNIPQEDYVFEHAVKIKCVNDAGWTETYLQKDETRIVEFDNIKALDKIQYNTQIVKATESKNFISELMTNIEYTGDRVSIYRDEILEYCLQVGKYPEKRTINHYSYWLWVARNKTKWYKMDTPEEWSKMHSPLRQKIL